MKTIKLIIISVISIITLVSCNKEPLFKFDLKVIGDVENYKNNISATFDTRIQNDTIVLPLNTDIHNYTTNLDGIFFMNDFLDDYVYSVVDTTKTYYDILVNGYIENKETGIVLKVHKKISNKE